MHKNLFILLFILFSIQAFSQSYSSPESVEYDPINNRYIVSNTNSGNLQSVTPGQSPTLFTSDVSAPYGLAEYNGVVYVCDDGFVKGYSLTTALSTFSLDLNGSFLNGICSDGMGRLFVTDFSAKKIYVVNIADQTFDVVIANTGSTPNGILFDEAHARLIFCTWGSSAKLIAVDTATFAMTPKITTSLSNIDGVVQDRCGNFFVSEWGTDKIYKIDSLFSSPTAVFTSGISNPADIFFNTLNDTLAVPNTSTNTVLFFDADFCTEIVDTTDYTSINENGGLSFDVIQLSNEVRLMWMFNNYPSAATIDVMDMNGRIIKSVQLSPGDLSKNTYAFPIETWASGIYLISIKAGNQAEARKVYIGRQ